MQESTSRRDFVKGVAAAALASAALGSTVFGQDTASAKMDAGKIAMPPLPYALNALEPVISAKTVDLHYNQHHKAYYDIVMKMVPNTPWEKDPLAGVIQGTAGGINLVETLFFMAVLAYNHDMYWKSLIPGGGGIPNAKLSIAKKINSDFGSFAEFKTRFKATAMQLGIGWVWLCVNNGKLEIIRTEYHDTPIVTGKIPLLAIDVWEHAYYMDYQNRRDLYIDGVLDKLVNWEFAEAGLVGALPKKK